MTVDLWTLVRIVVKRWLVVVPVLVATIAAAALFVLNIEPQYSGFSSLVMVSDDPAAYEAATNPSGMDPGALVLAANVVAEVLNSEETRQQVAAGGAEASYEVSVDPGQPIVRVVAEGDDDKTTVAAAAEVLDAVGPALATRQEGENAVLDPRVAVTTLTTPSQAEGVGGGRYRAEGAVMFVAQTDTGQSVGTNPFTNLGRTTTTVIAELSQSRDFTKHLESLGATAGFEISPDPDANVLRITSEGTSAETVAATLEGVTSGLNQRLVDRQEAIEVPEALRVHHEVLAPAEVTQVPGDVKKPLIVLLGLGGTSAIGLAILVEGIMGRRRRRDESVDVPALDFDWSQFDADDASHSNQYGEEQVGDGAPQVRR